MGPRQEAQPVVFYECSLEDHHPQYHLLRSIDRFVRPVRPKPNAAQTRFFKKRPVADLGHDFKMLQCGHSFIVQHFVELNVAQRTNTMCGHPQQQTAGPLQNPPHIMS